MSRLQWCIYLYLLNNDVPFCVGSHSAYWLPRLFSFVPVESTQLLFQLQRCGVYFELDGCSSVKYGPSRACQKQGQSIVVDSTVVVPRKFSFDTTLLGAVAALACGVRADCISYRLCKDIQHVCWTASQVRQWGKELRARGYLPLDPTHRVSLSFVLLRFLEVLI